MLTWADARPYRETVWGEIGRILPEGGRARFANEITKNILVWGPNRLFAAALVAALAVSAFVISIPAGTSALRRVLRR
jgi:hypothetical protein